MTILNQPNDGLFNILIVIYKLLLEEPKNIEQIKKICTPGIVNPEKIGTTINSWKQLGLIIEDEDKLTIAQPYRLSGKLYSEEIEYQLPKILCKVVFSKENNKNLWDSRNCLSADFTRGLAWLLAQDVHKFNTQNHPQVQNQEFHQITEEHRMLQNDVRWTGLRVWSLYLGFAWESGVFVIDPTVAIRNILPDIFQDTKSLSAFEFIQQLKYFLPVLDFGEYRVEVEAVLNTAHWSKPPEGYLSTSLSRALKRLDHSRNIELQIKSDAQHEYYLLGSSGKAIAKFTHVIWLKG